MTRSDAYKTIAVFLFPVLVGWPGGQGLYGQEPARAMSAVVDGQADDGSEFLRPLKPKDHREAGDLWAMPMGNGRWRVSPLRQWSQTGIELRRGQHIQIRAGGFVQGCQRPVTDWAYGPWDPDGSPVEDHDGRLLCALVGRITGDGETYEFVVGRDFEWRAPCRGPLSLGVSDIWHYDNSGEFIAEIRVDGQPAGAALAAELLAPTPNLVPRMYPVNEAECEWVGTARQIEARREADRPMLVTDERFRPPLEIRARARTDSTNIRLYYGFFGTGQLIFNWEVRPDQLRVHDPATGMARGIRGAGELARDEYHDIVWRIGLQRMQVLVDGEERFRSTGDYGEVLSQVGIGPAWGSRVDVESIVVAPLDLSWMDATE